MLAWKPIPMPYLDYTLTWIFYLPHIWILCTQSILVDIHVWFPSSDVVSITCDLPHIAFTSSILSYFTNLISSIFALSLSITLTREPSYYHCHYWLIHITLIYYHYGGIPLYRFCLIEPFIPHLYSILGPSLCCDLSLLLGCHLLQRYYSCRLQHIIRELHLGIV